VKGYYVLNFSCSAESYEQKKNEKYSIERLLRMKGHGEINEWLSHLDNAHHQFLRLILCASHHSVWRVVRSVTQKTLTQFPIDIIFDTEGL
jgi:hypothetical protein